MSLRETHAVICAVKPHGSAWQRRQNAAQAGARAQASLARTVDSAAVGCAYGTGGAGLITCTGKASGERSGSASEQHIRAHSPAEAVDQHLQQAPRVTAINLSVAVTS